MNPWPVSPLRRTLLCFLATAGTVRAQVRPGNQTALPEQVKAAYIYNFVNFVDWPGEVFAETDSPLQIGVVDAEKLADQLALTVAGRTVRGRGLTVHKLRPRDGFAGLQILVVGTASKAQLAELLIAARDRPILLVTEAEGALASGSMINFVKTNERLRFEIAPRTAEHSGLTISARLLAAALHVEGR